MVHIKQHNSSIKDPNNGHLMYILICKGRSILAYVALACPLISIAATKIADIP